jgi:hypothetical protein
MPPTMEEVAEAAINEYEREGQAYAAFVHRELELEAGRPAVKCDAIRRILGASDAPNTNIVNGRPHSASSAEAVVETDHGYRAYLTVQHEVVLSKHAAYTRMTSARLRAELAIGALKAQAGLR